MLAAALAVVDEAHHHVGPDGADHAHVVAEDGLAAPLLERLLDAEREAEVDRAREVLLGAVELVHRRQFFGAQHGERFEDLRADLVLPAFAARGGDERRAEALRVPVVGEQRVVLVVGMRRGHHHVAHRVELAQGELERGPPGERGHRLQPVLRVRGHERQGERERDEKGDGQQSAHGQSSQETQPLSLVPYPGPCPLRSARRP